jgi:signal transduction histidine kinase
MEAALKEQDRLAALGVMAAGVAHEVNTPLTGISSYAQMLLADTPEDDPRHLLLRKVERQTFRAAKIVNNLLDFARSRKGELGPVDLAAVVGECLDLMHERLARRGVVVEWNPPAEGAVVVGDAGELQQVVTNLVLNAHDAMPEGGTLTLELGEDAGRLCLVVTDTGVGIPGDLLAHVFEPFVTTRLGQGGTGLGLAISHDIVRHHGGELAVESEPGQGARFTLTLPAAPAAGGGAPA